MTNMIETEALLELLESERMGRKEADEHTYLLFSEMESWKRKAMSMAQLQSALPQVIYHTHITEANPYPVWILALDGTLHYANDAANQILEIWKPESDFWKQILLTLSKHPRIVEIEIPVKDSIFACTFLPFLAENAIYVYAKDISDFKKTQESLYISEFRYRRTIEFAGDLIYRVKTDLSIAYINPFMERVIGLTEDLAKESESFSWVKADYREKVVAELKAQIAERKPVIYQEFPINTLKGEDMWIGQNLNLIVAPDGSVLELMAFARDITARVASDSRLQETSIRLSALVENLQSGVIVEDVNHHLALINEKMCEMFDIQVPVSELIGKACSECIIYLQPKFKYPSIFASYILEKNLSKDVATDIEWEMSDGKVYSCDFVPIHAEGKYMGALWQFRDVTEQHIQSQKMKEAQERAEASSKAKEIFLAKMSHEIRTPMNAIMGMVGLLENTHLTGKQKSHLDAVKISAHNLLTIINDILDVSKIESGLFTLEYIGFNINKLVEVAISSLSYMAASKSIALNADIDPNIPSILIGDPVRINQIFLNLISNALKFTLEGSVNLRCQMIAETDTHCEIECKIIDTGIGIDASKLDAIFEIFTQEDESTTRKFGGTGLGLSISKQLVEMMGGTIQVKSKKGVGTTFSFRLNLKKGVEADLPNDAIEATAYRSLRGVKALLVEDNTMNQFLATAILESWHMAVEIAENGEIALELLRRKKYDIILMDVQMPIMGGVEATRHIRQNLNMDIPIIAVSANALKGDKEKYLDAGMNDYISKPFEQDVLFKKMAALLGNVNDYLQRQEENKLVEEDTPKPLTVSMLAQQLYDLSKLRATSRGNEAFVQRMIKLFLEQIPDSLNQLNEAYKKNDLEKVRSIAHQIKPTIDALNIHQLRGEIRLLEKYAEEGTRIEELTVLMEKMNQVMQLVIAEIKKELQ